MTATRTPSQTIGPFFHDALMRDAVEELDPGGEAGDAIEIFGRVVDGNDDPVTDAMLEFWQADGAGRYRHPLDGRHGDVSDSFLGFGRIATDRDGRYRIRTAKPGAVADRAGAVQAPHLNVHLFARGLLAHLWTRIYFDGEALGDDPVLSAVDEPRRHTLIAKLEEGGSGGVPRFRFDIMLQGDNETVFFAS